MAHWQAADGTRSSVLAISQLANILRRAIGKTVLSRPRSGDGLGNRRPRCRHGSTRPGGDDSRRMGSGRGSRVIFRFARTALIAACHDGHWWELDYLASPLRSADSAGDREPQAHYGCSPALITHPWLREAVKWYLGTMLESGALRWTTVSQERLRCLHRFDRWLAIAFDDPREARPTGPRRRVGRGVPPVGRRSSQPQRRPSASPGPGEGPARLVNDDLRAVAELFAFMAANQAEARRVLGPSPWDRHRRPRRLLAAAGPRIPHERALDDGNYVDDHALAQITAALPLLGLPRGEQMRITRGDGGRSPPGFDDPQAMRMICCRSSPGGVPARSATASSAVCHRPRPGRRGCAG